MSNLRHQNHKDMNESNQPAPETGVNRRGFLKTTTAVVGGSLLGGLTIEQSAHAAPDDTLKIALIGCGGRGSGAADQALSTSGPVKLVAMADAVPNRLKDKLGAIKANVHGEFADRVDVSPKTANSWDSTPTKKPLRWPTW